MTAIIKEEKDSLEEYLSNVEKLTKKFVFVGIHGKDDSDVLQYAIKNEFGSGNIPSRPFLRQSYDKNLDELKKLLILTSKKVFEGKLNINDALFLVGNKLVDFINDEINNNQFIPNSALTIKLKGKGKHPLQDTGRLQQSIKAIVE